MFSRLEHNGTVSYKCSEESITHGDLVVSHNYLGATVSNLTPTFKVTYCESWSSFLRDAPPVSQRRYRPFAVQHFVQRDTKAIWRGQGDAGETTLSKTNQQAVFPV